MQNRGTDPRVRNDGRPVTEKPQVCPKCEKMRTACWCGFDVSQYRWSDSLPSLYPVGLDTPQDAQKPT